MNITTDLASLPPLRTWYLELWDECLELAIYFISILGQLGYYLALPLIVYYVTGLITYMYQMHYRGRPIPIRFKERVLFVIAHPDDECMFFGPTIMTLRGKYDVHLLCLTTGKPDTKRQRKKELYKSCGILGIPTRNITLMDITDMPDHRANIWNSSKTARILLDFIETYTFKEVYSFDLGGVCGHVVSILFQEYRYGIGGVSGHVTNVSVFLGLARLCLDNEFPSYCNVYILETDNAHRQFSVFYDALGSSFNRCRFLVTRNEAKEIRTAIFQYRCRMTWFLVLNSVMSRYLWINTYKLLELEDVLLVIEMMDMNSHM